VNAETPSRSSRAPERSADYNLRILWTLARYFEDRHGADGLAALAAAGGITPAELEGGNHWVSADAFEAMLSHARGILPDEEEYKRACAYRIEEAYGPLRYILWAITPAGVYAQASRQFKLMSTCGELKLTGHGPTWAHASFSSRVPYSRNNCLLRHAQSVHLPTLWGLPPAHLHETQCAGLGDPTCEYHWSWYTTRRWLPPVLGAVLAGLVGWALVHLGMPHVPTPVFLALLGATVGYLLEVRRTERVNERTRQEVMGAFRDLAYGESDARRELLEMHQRQKDWTRLVEEEMNARAAAIQHAVSDVQEVHSARASTLLGFSHDLRNPLQVIQMSAEYLDGTPTIKSDSDARDALGAIQQSVDRMRRMLGDLVRVTKAQRDFVQMTPQAVLVPALTDGLRRRLRALVHGRDVRGTVFATREAPSELQIDPLALDRILDNLLTNAAKYTDRGSIVVELDGTPGFLVLKVSDTGCGIPPDALDRIFEPGGSSVRSRRGDSFGVGLSVVVQLLDQIGGKLEIMSRPGAGTTFWVYLPLEVRAERLSNVPSTMESAGAEVVPIRAFSPGGALSRVVTIRKLPA
jgi:signal transduction histidine kinase